MIYLLLTNYAPKDAIKFYSVLNNDDLLKTFKSVILQRSVFSNFVILKENQKESLLTVNIFKKKNNNLSEYDSKKLDKIIDFLRKKWINE